MERVAFSGGSTAPTRTTAWYCVRSQPKHEHIAAARLAQLEGVEVFCPRIKFKRATRPGLVWVTEAMFPGYLFARFDLEGMHLQVRSAPGVRCIVRFGERYPTLEDATLEQLRDETGPTGVKTIIHQVSEGDEVTVMEGAFVGLQAVVTQVFPAGRRVKILMDFLGRTMEAELPLSRVRLQAAPLPHGGKANG